MHASAIGRGVVFVAVIAILTPAIHAADQAPARRLAAAMTDPGCHIVIDAEKDQWRDATAADFSSSGWKAWMAQTGGATPWRATGDFDGDGVADLAKVVVRKDDGVWMVGVEFAQAHGQPCRRQQIASNMGVGERAAAPLMGVLTWPRDTASIACHHAAERMPTVCRAPQGSTLAQRKADALLIADDVPVTIDAWLWQADGNIMAFKPVRPDLIIAQVPAAAGAAKAAQNGDAVTPAERAKLIAELDAAYEKLATLRYRVVGSTAVNGAAGTETTTEFESPRKMRVYTGSPNADGAMIAIGARAWLRSGGAWQEAGSAATFPTGGAEVGEGVITRVREESVKGATTRVVELRVPVPGADTPLQRRIALDANGRLLETVDTLGDMITTAAYRYDADFAPIAAPVP